jgi:hypothetical protein
MFESIYGNDPHPRCAARKIGEIKWLWRLPIFRGWLVTVPYIQGTWYGDLQSTWVNPTTGAGIPPLKVILIVRQALSTDELYIVYEGIGEFQSCCADRIRGGNGSRHGQLQLHQSLKG